MKLRTVKTRKKRNPYYGYEAKMLSSSPDYSKKLTTNEMLIVTAVACKHFSIPLLRVQFWKLKKLSGKCIRFRNIKTQQCVFSIKYSKRRIFFGKNIYTYGLVAHEVAHGLQYIRTGKTKDNNDLLPFVEEVLNYINSYMTKHL